MAVTPKRVTLFTSPGCPWCAVARRYLADHDIDFTEIDVSSDRTGMREMVLMTAQHGVPVLLVGGKTLVGWNADEFDELYSA